LLGPLLSKNGPYLVLGDLPLSKQTIVTNADGGSEAWQESAAFKPQKKYALCRCGHSKTKPFCDGSHVKHGFDGSETAGHEPYLNEARTFDGPTMVLTDVEQLWTANCIGYSLCVPNIQTRMAARLTRCPICQAR